jgi:branched-chain amino acid transport system permease protein
VRISIRFERFTVFNTSTYGRGHDLANFRNGGRVDFIYFSQAIANMLMLGTMYALMALGFTMIYGISRIVNFAHGEIYMVGSFVVYYIVLSGVPYFLGIILGSITMGFLGIILERILFRPVRYTEPGTIAEFPSVVITLALIQIFPAVTFFFCGVREKNISSGIDGMITAWGIAVPLERVMVIIVGLGIFFGLLFFIKYHREGRALNAAAQDLEAAVLQGVHPDHAARLSFGIGFGLAAAAGALVASVYFLAPTIGPEALLKAFIVVVLGGIGSIPGTLLGGLVVGFIESFGRVIMGGNLPLLLAFLLIVILLIFRPRGLLGHD